MHRIPSNSRVRRRLFEDDGPTEQAKNENFTNALKESVIRDLEEKSRKWSYDFVKDVPLEGIGNYQWYERNGTEDWIGIPFEDDDNSINDDSCLAMRRVNEVTPMRGIAVPSSRKRRANVAVNPNSSPARRRICFD